MIATIDWTMVPVPAVEGRAPEAQDARDLALGYLRYASACWRGDAVTAAFAAGLGAFWRRAMPPVPASPPDVVSPHGGGGRGICWYQRGGEILGYVPGAPGGYVVPVADVPRLLRCVPAAPCTIEHHGEHLRRPATKWHDQDGTMRALVAPPPELVEYRPLAVV
jgi:hypothetical protein